MKSKEIVELFRVAKRATRVTVNTTLDSPLRKKAESLRTLIFAALYSEFLRDSDLWELELITEDTVGISREAVPRDLLVITFYDEDGCCYITIAPDVLTKAYLLLVMKRAEVTLIEHSNFTLGCDVAPQFDEGEDLGQVIADGLKVLVDSVDLEKLIGSGIVERSKLRDPKTLGFYLFI